MEDNEQTDTMHDLQHAHGVSGSHVAAWTLLIYDTYTLIHCCQMYNNGIQDSEVTHCERNIRACETPTKFKRQYRCHPAAKANTLKRCKVVTYVGLLTNLL